MNTMKAVATHSLCPVQHVGVAWFAEEDYPAWRCLLPDRSWHPSLAAWKADATRCIQEYANVGVIARSVHVSPVDLIAWCDKAGRAVDAHALAHYANAIACVAPDGD
jgi:hypothetical protein